MVLCKHCDTRVVSRDLSVRSYFPPNNPNDDLGSDPSMLSISFRCPQCKTGYTFTRIVTSDELLEVKKKDERGCGGCGG